MVVSGFLGPSHAEEVVIKQPTTVAVSSKDEKV